MSGFFAALGGGGMPFLRNALFAGFLSSILFGALGSVLTVRRMTSLAGSISHAVLGGIGLALFLSSRGIVPGLPPIAGALVFALLSAVLIGFVSLKARQREDTVINAIWAIGMSLGVLFLAKTPGYVDPMSYLFGNILLVSARDLWMLAGLDAIVLLLLWRFYRQVEASSFDPEFAAVRGVPSDTVFMVILVLTAVAVVLLQTFVGIVMVIAMLTLPAGTASHAARSLAGMMVFATVLAAVFSTAGLATGWALDLPAGAVTVVLAGSVFMAAASIRVLAVRLASKKRGRVA
ncbi:MAG TPA: metal ABC transporter permease [Spirochaetales bacterium]|nr:metal ABC transporter permease [Spirochaetales bacterium]